MIKPSEAKVLEVLRKSTLSYLSEQEYAEVVQAVEKQGLLSLKGAALSIVTTAVQKHGTHDQSTHNPKKGGGGGSGSGASSQNSNSQKYIDAGYNEETCNEISSKLENSDEEMEEALSDLEDEFQQQGGRSKKEIKDQIQVVERSQKLSSDARVKVDDATRPIKTDKDFDQHIGLINEANGDIEDAINALGNGDNSVQSLQSTLRDALGQIREYQDGLDDTVGL